MDMDLYNHLWASGLVGGISAFILSVGLSVGTNVQRRVIGLLAVVVFFVVACAVFGYAG
jgi:hypothetical protein